MTQKILSIISIITLLINVESILAQELRDSLGSNQKVILIQDMNDAEIGKFITKDSTLWQWQADIAYWNSKNDNFWKIVEPKVEKTVNPLSFGKGIIWLYLLVFTLTILSIILACYVFFANRKKHLRKIIIKELLYSKSYYGKKSEIEEWSDSLVRKAVKKVIEEINKSGISNQYSKINEQELSRLFDRYLANKNTEAQRSQEQKLQDQPQSQPQPQSQQVIIQQNESKVVYADSIVNDQFNKITNQANDDTIYELHLKKPDDNRAEFTIHEAAKRRVLKNTDFIDGCDKLKINQIPIDLQVDNGIAILLENGKWQITQRAKVKFV